MKKVFILIVVTVVFVVIYSCNKLSSDDDIEIVVDNVDIPAETSTLKNSIKELKSVLSVELPKIYEVSEKTLARGDMNKTALEIQDLSESEAKEVLSTLSKPIVKMLKAQGFTENDWAEFEDTNDPAFILAGILYLGMYESNSENVAVPLMKSDDENSCWDLDRIVACAGVALGIDAVINAFKGIGCITQSLALATLKTLAKSVVGIAGAVILIAQFSECMGWI